MNPAGRDAAVDGADDADDDDDEVSDDPDSADDSDERDEDGDAPDAAVPFDAGKDPLPEEDAAAPGESDAGEPLPVGPSGPSAGCGQRPPDGDLETDWTKHDLMVSGVAERYLEGGEEYGEQQGYDFSHRNYFLRLPVGYDVSKPYALLISGGGCGTTNGISGQGGGANPLPADQDVAVQVGLSYVYSARGGACFEDDSADTPDLPYFDAVMAELDARYCFDRAKVFVSGFSSGAWESYMLACARGGVVRGIGTQAGGLRRERPTCSNIPVAAFLTAGVNDSNPIENIEDDGFDSGSQAARDRILLTNGCTSRETEPYVTEQAPADWNCVSYSSCPKEYPVVWCPISADEGRHGAGSPLSFWPFWSSLPAR